MSSPNPRIYYIDNLRILLTFLVIGHHFAIANGAPGDWFYTESNVGEVESLLLTIFVATNQAYFMGFFFFISAIFVPNSLERKGARKFLKERFTRLGIPLLLYIFIVSPIVNFLVSKYAENYEGSLLNYVQEIGGFSLGPMWFVEVLLIFSLFYVIIETAVKKSSFSSSIITKKSFWVITIFLLLGVTYLVRIIYPVGAWIPLLSIQPAHFIQYILCFGLGIWVSKTDLLSTLNWKKSRIFFWVAQAQIFIGFPIMFITAGPDLDVDLYMGGSTWQSMLYVIWEQLLAFTIIIGLLGLFLKYFTSQNKFLKDISLHSYAIYVFHPLVVVSISLLFMKYEINTFLKFVVLLIPVSLFCYILAKLIRGLPFANKIF